MKRGVVLIWMSTLSGCLACEEMGCIGQAQAIIPASRVADGEWVWQADLPDADEFCVCVIEQMEIVSHNCARWSPRLEDGALVMTALLPPADPSTRMLDVEVGWGELGDDIILEFHDLMWSEVMYPNGRWCDGGKGCQSIGFALQESFTPAR
jgi:hypothetical protein